MKHDKIIEKWFKERNDKELSLLYPLIKDEQIKKSLLYAAFQWTVNECNELSILKYKYPLSALDTNDDIKLKSENISSAQIEFISKYRKSGICIRCKEPILGIVKESNKKDSLNVHLAGYLFLSVHEYSGLCIDCIGKFLLDFINKLNLDS